MGRSGNLYGGHVVHFGVPGFAGGCVGVDVFFVIPGFLMTQIIAKGLEGGHFSVPGFYLARARPPMVFW